MVSSHYDYSEGKGNGDDTAVYDIRNDLSHDGCGIDVVHISVVIS